MNDTAFFPLVRRYLSSSFKDSILQYLSIIPYNVKAELLSANDPIFFIVGPSRTD